MLRENPKTRGFAIRDRSVVFRWRVSLREQGDTLQRLFSTFPGGPPGVGLLLLRVALGVIAAVVGARYLTGDAEMRIGLWIAASLAIASGISLMIGVFTPASGAVVVLGGVGVALSWFPAPAMGVLPGTLAAWLVAVVAVAIILLGPGAFSLDARLFGRRVIVIRAAPNLRNP